MLLQEMHMEEQKFSRIPWTVLCVFYRIQMKCRKEPLMMDPYGSGGEAKNEAFKIKNAVGICLWRDGNRFYKAFGAESFWSQTEERNNYFRMLLYLLRQEASSHPIKRRRGTSESVRNWIRELQSEMELWRGRTIYCPACSKTFKLSTRGVAKGKGTRETDQSPLGMDGDRISFNIINAKLRDHQVIPKSQFMVAHQIQGGPWSLRAKSDG